MRFILGTPATSSWSLRAYLGAGELTKSANIDWRSFDAQSKLTDATDCPTRQVPVVYFDEAAPAIIETFAIIEALAERGGLCWPDDSLLRARARSFSTTARPCAQKSRWISVIRSKLKPRRPSFSNG